MEKGEIAQHVFYAIFIIKFVICLISVVILSFFENGVLENGLKHCCQLRKFGNIVPILSRCKRKERLVQLDQKDTVICMGIQLSDRVESTVGKREIARYEQFLLFPQCFQKPSNVDVS